MHSDYDKCLFILTKNSTSIYYYNERAAPPVPPGCQKFIVKYCGHLKNIKIFLYFLLH
jgi:hypothetical protein